MTIKRTYQQLVWGSILLLLTCLLTLPARADSDEKVKLNDEKWEETVDGVDYTEDYLEFEPGESNNSSYDGGDSGFSLAPLKYVFILLVILGLIYFVVKLISQMQGGRIDKEKISGAELDTLEALADPDADIEELNLDKMLQSALSIGNFKLALRIQYLKIVQLLSESGAIDWKKEKTNYDYLTELKSHEGYAIFRTLTGDFERIWYGDREINEREYKQRTPQYVQFQNSLTPHEQ